MKTSTLGSLVSLALASVARGAIYASSSDLKTLEYDFVIVGGGIGGSVVANRLTEDPSTSVLLLEAGGSAENILNSQIPLYCTTLAATELDWNYTTTPLIHANNQSYFYPRGRGLGGSSNINGMIYTRGSIDNWNHYARLVNDDGWSWKKIFPYFLKSERFVQPADKHNISGQFEPSVHSFTGVNSVSLPGFPGATDDLVLETTKELPNEFRYNTDYNTGKQFGIGWAQFTIGGGKRSSAATSYLGPSYIGRRNLNVLLHATVSRVLPTGYSGKTPIIGQVEFRNGLDGKIIKVRARKEVVLSGGTIGTPHILLNSGIGDQADLSKFGIKTLVNLPSVGRNLSEHPGVINLWPTNATTTYEALLRNDTARALALEEWQKTKTGPLVDSGPSHFGWIRVPENSTIFSQVPDPSPGTDTGHFELIVSNGDNFPPTPDINTIMIHSVNVNPVSRGTVSLNSSDPFSPPLIDLNFLAAEPDISIIREGIRSARRFIAASPWKDYITGPDFIPGTTDEELNTYIRSAVLPEAHPVGTASMSPKGASYGVVDPDLKVKGVVGLRIVDASILPGVPAAHTQAPTYAVAEKGSDLIKASW